MVKTLIKSWIRDPLGCYPKDMEYKAFAREDVDGVFPVHL
jgi:hypothetical protein